MNSSLYVLAATSFSLTLAAQTVTATAQAGLAGFLRAEHIGVAPLAEQLIAPGSNLTPGLNLAVASGVAHGTMTLALAQGPVVSFESNVDCSAMTFGTPGGAALSSSADFQFALHAEQPVHGMVWVCIEVHPSGGSPGFGNFSVDLDQNGTWDLVGDPMGGQWQRIGQFGRSFGPGALPIRVVHTGSVTMPANDIGEYSARVIIRWFPDTGPVTSYGVPCGLTLWHERAANGTLLLRMWPAPIVNTWLLFGDTQTNAPLYLPPHCPLLTDIDYFAWWGSGDFVVPNVPLPRGFVMNAQAVTFVSPESTPLSNGLRLVVVP